MSETDPNTSDDGKRKRLTITRRAHRGQMTKLINKGTTMIEGGLQRANKEHLDILEGLVESMNTKLSLLADLDKEIINITPENELEDTIVDTDEHMEELNTKVRTVKNALKRAMPNNLVETVARPNPPSERSPPKQTNLPKLELPRFNGDLLQWITFSDAFQAAVAADSNLSNIQKFQYLRAQLDGEAAKTISGLPLTNSNYDEAIELLEQRFGQTHKIISCYMKALWELKKPLDNISSVKDFYDNMETYIRGLRSLGKTEDAYGDLLVPIIFEKLPCRVKTQVSRDHGDKAWTLTELKEAIYKEIQANQAGDTMTLEEPISSGLASTAQFLTQGTNKYTNTHNARKQKCSYCKGSHYSNDCERIADVEKRKNIVKRDHLCYNCLKPNHSSKECLAKGRCKVCKQKHHTSLCQRIQNESKSEAVNNNTSVTVTTTRIKSKEAILLKTASSKLWFGNTATDVNILFDEGAQRTFVTKRIINTLNAKCSSSEDINLVTFGADNTKMRRVDIADLKLETRKGYVNLSALVVPKISTPMQNLVHSAIDQHSYLKGLELANHKYDRNESFEIDILIGADHFWDIVENDVVRGPGPTAVKSKLGYLLSGPTGTCGITKGNTMMYKVMVSPVEEAQAKLTDYWDLETIGIKDEDTKPCDYKSYRESKLSLENGKYVAGLPWKHDHPPLPTNYHVSERRTRSMVKRLSPDIRKTYSKVLDDQLQQDFIEIVPNDNTNIGHYIPHHPVYKESSTTPIRIVYDCSCSQGEQPSLNDCLDTGPCLMNDLVEILIRFRLHSIAFVSDIEKAFLNVKLDEKDRDYTKFLWLKDPDDPTSAFKTYRFKSVLFGSVSSPFILNAVMKTHLEKNPDATTEDMRKNIYVDNLVSGVSNESQAVDYYKKSVLLMKQGGFKLRSWATNSENLHEKISESKLQDKNKTVKVLGLKWNTQDDTLSYPTALHNSRIYTKREVVGVTSSLYDPLGMLSPVHIQAKIFIQKLWRANLGWDDPLQDELAQEWCKIQRDLNCCRNIKVTRPYFRQAGRNKMGPLEVHVFADASCQAYGAVIFLKRNTQCALVIAKSRVKPLKEITLPRLELLAAFTASRLTRFTLKTLEQVNTTKVVLWSDSQIVLHWLHSQKKLPQFVENRVKFIRESPFTDYKYCPTADNPADCLTRGITPEKLANLELWWNGPPWLGKGDWPVSEIPDSKVLTCSFDNIDVTPPLPNKKDTESLGLIMDTSRYSTMGRLLRVTSYVLRFINSLRGNQQQKHNFITVAELKTSQKLWIQTAQAEGFHKELLQLSKKTTDKCPLVHQLKLFLDKDGLIRCRGRLENAATDYDSKYPLLLPRHHFTDLLIREAHLIVQHAGLNVTTTFIRQRFWIPKIRQVVKRIIHTCVPCLKVSGKSYPRPEIPPLPKCRLQESTPFTVTGVDFTGTLYYKSKQFTDAQKAYICLFTCAVTRAVHLELVPDMTTWTFLQAFRRFAARRSLPSHMISDNATTFLAAAEEIRRVCQDNNIHTYLSTRNIEWQFIPKRAPWFGGFYERLIGITKTTLKKTLGKRLVTFDELWTLVTEIETIVNERPITYQSDLLSEPSALTPSMLVNGRSLLAMPHPVFSDDELCDPDFANSSKLLNEKAKQTDILFKQLWTRWKQEYLPALRESHMHNARNTKGTSENTIRVGDVVLVHDDSLKHPHWPLAVVSNLNLGNDGLVRSAEIKTKQGISNRPISKLYPLEVHSSNVASTVLSKEVSHEPQPSTTRPRRQAALKAKSLIKEWTNQ